MGVLDRSPLSSQKERGRKSEHRETKLASPVLVLRSFADALLKTFCVRECVRAYLLILSTYDTFFLLFIGSFACELLASGACVKYTCMVCMIRSYDILVYDARLFRTIDCLSAGYEESFL